MIAERTGVILKHIVEQYIDRAVPVPSQSIAREHGLVVSSATIRNEMAHLEKEGYIIRPHTSAGSVPLDKGYRYYVESLKYIELPPAERRLISHLFHQVEAETEHWLSLAATLLAQMVKNVAVVTMPKQSDCKFKHMELLSLQDSVVLAVVVFHGVKVKQKLITFSQPVAQPTLTVISNKLNAVLADLTCQQIEDKDTEFSPTERQVVENMVEIMKDEDKQEYEEPYLDGLHFMLNQPEFAHSERMRNLMELVEHRSLLKVIAPRKLPRRGIHVVIGKENKEEAIQDYSVVISQYGMPGEATGTIGVVGPTRMSYSHTIPAVDYLAAVLSQLVAGLYGKGAPFTEKENYGK